MSTLQCTCAICHSDLFARTMRDVKMAGWVRTRSGTPPVVVWHCKTCYTRHIVLPVAEGA